MKKAIITLGPAGTFSEAAAGQYAELKKISVDFTEANYRQIFEEVEKGIYSFGLVPIENLLDSYVGIVVDLLLEFDVKIVDEIIFPIQFAFISNTKNLQEVKTVYSQFKTQGQCRKFLDKFKKVRMITTGSNGESIEQIEKGISGEGAIVPSFILKQKGRFKIDNCFKVENVTDYKNNETRFIVISGEEASFINDKKFKTSLAVTEVANKPGALLKILKAFSDRKINLTQISSRPTKDELGKYHFLIDLEGYIKQPEVRDALLEVGKENQIKIFGSYPRAK